MAPQALADLARECHDRSSRVRSAIAADFARDGSVRLDVPSYGWIVLVHRSTSGPPFRVTRFDHETMTPEGHTEASDLDGAAAEAFALVGHSAELRALYP